MRQDDGVWDAVASFYETQHYLMHLMAILCEQSAPRSKQITTPTPHHSIFTDWMLFPMLNQQCQSIDGKNTDGNSRVDTNSITRGAEMARMTQWTTYTEYLYNVYT